MKIIKKKFDLIKNLPLPSLKFDFRYHTFSFFILMIFLSSGVILQYALIPEVELLNVVYVTVGALAAGVIIMVLPWWSLIIMLLAGAWIDMFAFLNTEYYPLLSMI